MAHDPAHVVREWFNRHHRGVTPLPRTGWNDDVEQPRVLVECDDGASGWAASKVLERSGSLLASRLGNARER